MRVLRLFNEDHGRDFLSSLGVNDKSIDELSLLGISSIGNLLAAIKTAKYFEMRENDVLLTVFTDSVEMYRSRLNELLDERGEYSAIQAAMDFAGPLAHQGIDFFKELSYYDKKAIHNLKYFTWVEQQGRSSEELKEQWEPSYWKMIFEEEVVLFDKLIDEFNQEVAS